MFDNFYKRTIVYLVKINALQKNVTQWITFNIADDIVKQRDLTQQSFGISAPKKKRSKTDETALKTEIITAKTTDYLQKIQKHQDSILSNPKPPLPELLFDSTLLSVSELADIFAEYWGSYNDAELSAMVFRASSGMPGSTLSEQSFSHLEFQTTVNQSPETLQDRTRLQYAHLNNFKFDMTQKNDFDK